METLLASTFTGILMFVVGFWLAWSFRADEIAELRGKVGWLQRMRERELTRTDAENAAGMVS